MLSTTNYDTSQDLAAATHLQVKRHNCSAAATTTGLQTTLGGIDCLAFGPGRTTNSIMMRASTSYLLRLLAVAVIAAALPAVLAHGDDEGGMDMDMGDDMDMPPKGEPEPAPEGYETYFAHQEHAAKMYAHIALMTVSWVLVLPVGKFTRLPQLRFCGRLTLLRVAAVMFSIARSRYTLALQFAFTIFNALGVVVGLSYNANTPDLYPNNAHHKLGWIVTWITAAQALVCLVGRVAGVLAKQDSRNEEQQAFIPVSTQAMAEHQRMNDSVFAHRYRRSDESGGHSDSQRSGSISTMVGQESPTEDRRGHFDDLDDLELKPAEMESQWRPKPNTLVAKVAAKISTRAWKVLLLAYNVIDRTILILGFVTMCTGVITYGRFFVSLRLVYFFSSLGFSDH